MRRGWRPPRARRVLQFAGGLALCATGVWTSLQAGLGVSSWDVLHAGLAARTGLSFGVVVAAVGVVVLGLSALLGVRPKVGTLVNVAVIAVTLDALLGTSWLDGVHTAPVLLRAALLLVATALLGVGGALYIGAGFGAGPRDSLMVACHRHGLPVGVSRIGIEVLVVIVGWLLGGPVGVGTVAMAFALGPVTQLAFRVLHQRPDAGLPAPRRPPEGGGPRRA